MNATNSLPGGGKAYGDTYVSRDAVLHQGDIYQQIDVSGDIFLQSSNREILLLQTKLQQCPRHSISVAEVQQLNQQLTSLSRILASAQAIEKWSTIGDSENVQNLRSIAFATTHTIRLFNEKLRDEFPDLVHSSEAHENQESAVNSLCRLSSEIERLQHYVHGQVLAIGMLLSLMQRQSLSRLEDQVCLQRADIAGQIQTHMDALNGLRSIVTAVAQNITESSVTAAKESMNLSQSLMRMQNSINRLPSMSSEDSIQLVDALNRTFALPYCFFRSWETFLSFLKNSFDPSSIPGGRQIESGNFLLTKTNTHAQAVSGDNWGYLIHPGCQLIMSVILTALKVSLSRCPRARCRAVPTIHVDEGASIECPKCGLIYRYDRNINMPQLVLDDNNISRRQRQDDLRRFGERVAPTDTVDDLEERRGSTAALSHWFSDQQDVSLMSQQDSQRPNPETSNLSSGSVDWNSGKSALEAWLNTSAMPMKDPTFPEILDQSKETSDSQDLKALESLQRVHFIGLATEAKPLPETTPKYQNMPLDEQISFRRIADKYPSLPIALAERFARSSLVRKRRLNYFSSREDINDSFRPTKFPRLGSR